MANPETTPGQEDSVATLPAETPQGEPAAAQQTAPDETDWKAEATALRDKHARLEQSYKSLQGQIKAQEKVGTRLQKIEDDLAFVTTHLRKQVVGEPMTPEELVQADTVKARERLQNNLNTLKQTTLNHAWAIAGKAGFSQQEVNQQDAFDEVRSAWRTADQSGEPEDFLAVVRVMQDAVDSVVEQRHKAEELEKKKKTSLGMDTGTGAPRAKKTLDTLLAQRIDKLSPKELREYEEQFNKALAGV